MNATTITYMGTLQEIASKGPTKFGEGKNKFKLLKKNQSREKKGEETCQQILVENDVKRKEEKTQNLDGQMFKNEFDQCIEYGFHMARQT